MQKGRLRKHRLEQTFLILVQETLLYFTSLVVPGHHSVPGAPLEASRLAGSTNLNGFGQPLLGSPQFNALFTESPTVT